MLQYFTEANETKCFGEFFRSHYQNCEELMILSLMINDLIFHKSAIAIFKGEIQM